MKKFKKLSCILLSLILLCASFGMTASAATELDDFYNVYVPKAGSSAAPTSLTYKAGSDGKLTIDVNLPSYNVTIRNKTGSVLGYYEGCNYGWPVTFTGLPSNDYVKICLDTFGTAAYTNARISNNGSAAVNTVTFGNVTVPKAGSAPAPVAACFKTGSQGDLKMTAYLDSFNVAIRDQWDNVLATYTNCPSGILMNFTGLPRNSYVKVCVSTYGVATTSSLKLVTS